MKNKWIILEYVATLIIIPLTTITVCIFWPYRQIVNLLLMCKLKSRYKGLLNGPDRFWLLTDKSKPVINILLIINHPSETIGFYESIKSRLEDLRERADLFKLRCSASTFMGYQYLIDNSANVIANIKRLDGNFYADEQTLRETVNGLASSDISCDAALWEVMIGEEEIQWECRKRRSFPVIVRFHHCLADGLALLHLLRQGFSSSDNDEDGQLQLLKAKGEKDDGIVDGMVKIAIRCVHFLIVFWKMPQTVFRRLRKPTDSNVLHGDKVSGDKITAYRIEPGYKYINKVKTIKRKLHVGFADVIASAFGYSIDKLFKIKGTQVEDISLVIPAIGNSQNLHENECTNRFSVGILDMPLLMPENPTLPYSARCLATHSRLLELKTSYEFQVNYWFLHIVGKALPDFMLSPLFNSAQSTGILSNLPGPKKTHFDEGDSIEDIVFWIPHRGLTGVGISIFSYDGRLQLGLTIDKHYQVTDREADHILEDALHYLDCLYNEILKNST